MGRKMKLGKLPVIVALGAFPIVIFAASGHAATLKATPSIALEETWDTNIFNTASDEQSDFISRATPGLAFALELERTTVRLSGSVTGERYADHDELNIWDATKRAELSAPKIGITPRLSLQAAARYIETIDLANRNELVFSPIQGLPPTETLVVGRTEARHYGGSLQATYQATQNVDLGFGGGGTKTEYLTAAPGLIDSRTVTGNVSGRYRISPRTTAGISGSTAYTARDDESTSRSYSGGLTGTFTMTEKTSVDAGAGVTFLTDSRGGGAVEHVQSPYGKLGLNYRGGGFSAALAGSYELTGGGSFGEATDRTNASLTLAEQVTPKWSVDLNGYYQNERTAGAQAGRKVETAGGTAGVRYAAAGWIAFRLAGHTFRQWTREATDADITRSDIMLGLTLSDTYLLF